MQAEDLEKIQKRVERSVLELTRLYAEITAYCDELARGQGWDDERIKEARRVSRCRANMMMSAIEHGPGKIKPRDRS